MPGAVSFRLLLSYMSGKRRIAYGVGNWPELVRDGRYFYVDHTAYVCSTVGRRSYALAKVKADNL